MSNFVHHVRGRLRIHVPALRANPAAAAGIRALLTAQPGVCSVEARAITGSVVLRYNPQTGDVAAIASTLAEAGFISPETTVSADSPAASRGKRAARNGRANKLVEKAVEKALEHSITLLVAAVL